MTLSLSHPIFNPLYCEKKAQFQPETGLATETLSGPSAGTLTALHLPDGSAQGRHSIQLPQPDGVPAKTTETAKPDVKDAGKTELKAAASKENSVWRSTRSVGKQKRAMTFLHILSQKDNTGHISV